MNIGGTTRLAAGLLSAAIAVAALASLALADRQGSPSARAGAAEECKNAETPVHRLSAGAVRGALLCLVNEERRRHARHPVEKSNALDRAAQQHAEKMAETDCLSHQCPGEGSLGSRIRKSGYTAGADDWEFAENTGCGLSAAAMVKNWLASRYHRINILDGRFEDLGVGYTRADVERRCRKSFGTFAAVFAMREPG